MNSRAAETIQLKLMVTSLEEEGLPNLLQAFLDDSEGKIPSPFKGLYACHGEGLMDLLDDLKLTLRSEYQNIHMKKFR